VLAKFSIMNKIICISFFFCCISFLCSAQTDFNVELQVYPTGVIPGIRIENKIGEKTKVHLRLGLNIFDHRDLGVQDNESGWGYGFTLGGSKTLGQSKFELGLRYCNWNDRHCCITTDSGIKLSVSGQETYS